MYLLVTYVDDIMLVHLIIKFSGNFEDIIRSYIWSNGMSTQSFNLLNSAKLIHSNIHVISNLELFVLKMLPSSEHVIKRQFANDVQHRHVTISVLPCLNITSTQGKYEFRRKSMPPEPQLSLTGWQIFWMGEERRTLVPMR